MSSGVPILPTGIMAIPALTTSGGMEAVISDSINPGAIALAVMPKRPTSRASALVNPATPALVAE